MKAPPAASKEKKPVEDPAFLHLYGECLNGLCSQFEPDGLALEKLCLEDERCRELSERAFRVAFRAWELLQIGRLPFCEPYSEAEAEFFNSMILRTNAEPETKVS